MSINGVSWQCAVGSEQFAGGGCRLLGLSYSTRAVQFASQSPDLSLERIVFLFLAGEIGARQANAFADACGVIKVQSAEC